ncbi:MAG: hypothetical protein AB1938_07010 [Myxococcota bacterium]
MTPTPASEQRAKGLVAVIIVTAVWMVVANAHDAWRPLLGGLVTPAFADVLWAVNLACAVQMVGSALLLMFDTPALRGTCDLLNALAAAVGAVAFWRVFPLELTGFGAWAEVTARVLLVLAFIGAGAAVLVSLTRLALGGEGPPRSPRPSHP